MFNPYTREKALWLTFRELSSVCLSPVAPEGSSVRINKLTVEPTPIQVPGDVSISLDASVLQALSDFDLNVTLIKEMGNAKITVSQE